MTRHSDTSGADNPQALFEERLIRNSNKKNNIIKKSTPYTDHG